MSENIYRNMGISDEVFALSEEIEESLRERFHEIDRIAEANQMKVLCAMQKVKLAEAHLNGTTGYGYNDSGREALEDIYANVFHTEKALVRSQITCGTHALALAYGGNLRPGDGILSISGEVYDTLQGVIGVRPEKGSLAEYGITYDEVKLLPDSGFDRETIAEKLKNEKIRLVSIQRSRGYSTRQSLRVEQIAEIIPFVKELRPDVILLVDNCYGEFVETIEPSDVGADIVVGSLIKNPGGGIAPIGGYVAGKAEYVEQAAIRLTTPGLAGEVGASLGNTRLLTQGLFYAPAVTAAAVKGAIFTAKLFEHYGYKAFPESDSPRADIIEAITFGKPELVQAFCEGIQAAAPVDSFVKPIPWDMPGYDCPVIMAAGAFVSGASIELSADAPMKPPYTVFFQGGLTYPHAKYGALLSMQKMKDAGLI